MDKHQLKQLFRLVKEQRPLVHHITNQVTMNDCANVTLAIGASPVMTIGEKEVKEMVRLADALVLNIGTLTDSIFTSIVLAGQQANENGIPVIFDPVGAGGTTYRTERAIELLEKVKVSIIRGNGSELEALLGGKSVTRGVDEGKITKAREEIATQLAKQTGAVTVVSGEKDFISNGKTTVQLSNGHPWLSKITGTGCMSTSIIGSFAGTKCPIFDAAIVGASVIGIAGERAYRKLREDDGIGTFKMKLMDEIFFMDGERWVEEVHDQ